MDQLPSKPILKTPIAGDAQASKTPSDDSLLLTGIPPKYSNEIVPTWSNASISYSPGDNVVWNGYVYVCTSSHESTSQNPQQPGTPGAPWTQIGLRTDYAQNYLLRGDMNWFMFALSDFWFCVQCLGMKTLDFSSTSGSVITGGQGGFPKHSVRTVISTPLTDANHEFLVAESKNDDNRVAPVPANLISGTDANWSLLTPSLNHIDIFTNLKYSRNNALGQANPNVIYAVPSQTSGQNWGYGTMKNVISQNLTKSISSIFAASSPISEVWYMEKQADIPLGSSDTPKLRQVYGWRNSVNQKIIGNGITSGCTSVTLLRGRYKIIVIGGGGGPYTIEHPCSHYYGNPGNGGAGLYGIVKLDHGIYQIGVTRQGSYISSGDTNIVFAQVGQMAFVLTQHTDSNKSNVAPSKVTYQGSLFVEVTAKNGSQGSNNGWQDTKGETTGTGGVAPFGTVYEQNCSSYGKGAGRSSGSQQYDAGSGFVYIEYAGPYDGIPNG